MFFYNKHLSMNKKAIDIDKLVAIRKELHKKPEISGHEVETSKKIVAILSKFNPDKLITQVGGYGVVCVFEGIEKGKSILFRCDMDALPITEINNFDYKSENEGVSHKCGHDGHMTILLGLAEYFSNNPIKKGAAVLLFQPSEENGEGAFNVINDSRFKDLSIDYGFALHNLPGYNKGAIILNRNTFSAASKGVVVKLFGKTSHAGEPEDGISPAIAMADIVKEIQYLPKKEKVFSDYVLTTVVHAKLGEVAFGTSPGYAHVMATLRSYSNKDMNTLTEEVERIVGRISKQELLDFKVAYTEEFPATVNDTKLVDVVEGVAREQNLEVIQRDEPFRWSEDFGHITEAISGVLFGLGSGETHPQLHNPDYDFPDKIIEKGVSMFRGIFENLQL